jgi:RNA polymerase sigma-70 factor (ECF subfamily)
MSSPTEGFSSYYPPRLGSGASSMRKTQALLAAAREGEDWAVEELLRVHAAAIYRLALGMLGEPQEAAEVCRGVFLRFFGVLRRLRTKSQMRAWLRRVAVHRCLNILRSRRKVEDLETAVLPGCMLGGESFTPADISNLLQQSLAYLLPTERAALMLTCHQGYSLEEAGKAMGISPDKVLNLAVKSRLRLRSLLGDTAVPSAGQGAPKEPRLLDYLNAHLNEPETAEINERLNSDVELRQAVEEIRREIAILRSTFIDPDEERCLNTLCRGVINSLRRRRASSLRGMPLPVRSYLRASSVVLLVVVGVLMFFILHHGAVSISSEDQNTLGRFKAPAETAEGAPVSAGAESDSVHSAANSIPGEESDFKKIRILLKTPGAGSIHWFLLKNFEL